MGRRVAMIVPNAVLHDTRVLKSAASLTRRGLDVTVYGLAAEEHVLEHDGFTVHIVPFQTRFRDREREANHPGRTAADIHRTLKLDRAEIEIARRDAAADVGWIRADARRRAEADGVDLARQKSESVERLGQRKARLRSRTAKLPAPVRWVANRWQAIHELRYRNERKRQLVAAADVQKAVSAREEEVRRHLQDAEDAYAARRAGLIEALDDLQSGTYGGGTGGDWRTGLPILNDFEAALGPVLDDADVDAIHVHDFPLLGIAARSVGRSLQQGRNVHLVYDAHEYVAGLVYREAGVGPAWLSLEREYIHRADRVITVSDRISEQLAADYSLDRPPVVVLNAPRLGGPMPRVPSLRRLAGVTGSERLMVYSGNHQPERRVDTIIEALPLLPEDVHLAMVVGGFTSGLEGLLALAEEVGVAHRVHLVPYAPVDMVPQYLSEADLAIHPMSSEPLNHRLALPNKLFEYMHAGLPELVSDNDRMAEFIREHGIGEVFTAGDPEDLARWALRMLDDPSPYLAVYRDRPDLPAQFSWDSQEEALVGVYEDLFGEVLPSKADGSGARGASVPTPDVPFLTTLPVNTSGQAFRWATAVHEVLGVDTEVIARKRSSSFAFPTDRLVDPSEATLPGFRHAELGRWFGRSHVLVESGQSLFGPLPDRTFRDDLAMYESIGVKVGLVFHGSDIRRPDLHASLVETSPFRHFTELRMELAEVTHSVANAVAGFDGPIYVSTPDLLDYVPTATWLPLLFDSSLWHPTAVRLGERKPVVVTAATNEWLKGGTFADEVCWRLQEQGLIEYRRLRSLTREQLRDEIADADIFVDGLVLGCYGTTAVEAMASQKVVIANTERVSISAPDLPVVHADPHTLEAAIVGLIEAPDDARRLAQQGPAYVASRHSTGYVASVLAEFLDVGPR